MDIILCSRKFRTLQLLLWKLSLRWWQWKAATSISWKQLSLWIRVFWSIWSWCCASHWWSSLGWDKICEGRCCDKSPSWFSVTLPVPTGGDISVVQIYNSHAKTDSKALLYDPTITYFHQEHIPYVTLAITILLSLFLHLHCFYFCTPLKPSENVYSC